jgi:hypothetical protein
MKAVVRFLIDWGYTVGLVLTVGDYRARDELNAWHRSARRRWG